LLALGFVTAAVIGSALAGARVNSTKSLPLGLYWTVNAPPRKGALVIFCPPKSPVFDEAKARGYIDAGFCQGGYRQMIKEIVAAKGDHVIVSDKGVFVNGKLLENSKPRTEDPGDRPMPYYRADCMLQDNQVLLMSSYNPLSFDGRYFGPIDRAQIRSVIRPVFTWGLPSALPGGLSSALSDGLPNGLSTQQIICKKGRAVKPVRRNKMNEESKEIVFDANEDAAEALREKLADMETPGYVVECDPEEAELVGAFIEDALSEEDAMEATV